MEHHLVLRDCAIDRFAIVGVTSLITDTATLCPLLLAGGR